MILRYGQGNLILDYNKPVTLIMIKFRGNPYLKAREGITINKAKNIISFFDKEIEGNFCKYFGYLKILSCKVDNVNATVKTMNINLPELMSEFPEDISKFPEKMRNTYLHYKRYKGKQFRKRRIARTGRTITRTSRTTTRTGGGY